MIPRSFLQTQRCFSRALTDIIGQSNLRKSSPTDYKKLRELICNLERYGMLGNDIELTNNEVEVNNIVMELKLEEYNRGVNDPTQFVPGYHILQRLHKIEKSPLFLFIKGMPKGGALKAYISSMCCTDSLIKLSYMEHLWVRTSTDGCKIQAFRFSKAEPKVAAVEGSKWQPMAELREKRGENNVDEQLRVELTMLPFVQSERPTSAWEHMKEIYALVSGLLRYRPAFSEYIYNALAEFHADGVQYVEVRAKLQRFFDLDGNKQPVQETIKAYEEQLKRFKKDNPDFIDARIVFAPLRDATVEEVAKFVRLCTELNAEFPDLVIGFDLVGQEEVGEPLVKFVSELRKLPPHINLYLHAGQTNWSGTHVDENLIDAVLLGPKRIGHAVAITKHPLVMKLVQHLGIAIEVCPVCNQVLQLSADYRNHPAATLIANNVPIVISSGSPSFWRTTPLSHDFYMLFLGIAPTNSDLKLLKRISKNSIKYSSLPEEEKWQAMKIWNSKWDEWIEKTIKNKDKLKTQNREKDLTN